MMTPLLFQRTATLERGFSSFRRTGLLRLACNAVLLTVALLLLGVPAQADWLVTVDGELIETDGAWEQRGRLVTYTDLRGVLVSIRSSWLDIEKSRAVTARAPELLRAAAEARALEVERRKAEAEAARKEPAGLVVTNRTVGRARPMGPKILMYSADWCGVCKEARRKLDALGAAYYEKDIDRAPGAKAALKGEIGRVAVPHIRFDETKLEGFQTILTGYSAATLEAMVAEQKSVAKQPAGNER